MAVTHAEIEIRRWSGDLGSKAGKAVIVLCAFCGLLAFVFSLLAEFSKTKASWVMEVGDGGKPRFACTYSQKGGTALVCTIGGFVTLALAMIVLHAYMWAALAKHKHEGAPPSVHLSIVDSSTGLLAKQAALLFLSSWVCFGVAEVLLMIGVAVESSHLRRWRAMRSRCIVVRQGSFLAAAFFDLATVFLATAFYLVVLRMKTVKENEANTQREVMEAVLLSTPVTSGFSNMAALPSPNLPPDQVLHQPPQQQTTPLSDGTIVMKPSISR